MSLRASSSEHEAKKPLQSNCQIRTAVFWVYRHFMSLNSPPQDKIYPKTVANLGFNQRQRFFGARC
jgi:hypothetical protein